MNVEEILAPIRAAGPEGVSCFRNPACAHRHLDLRPLCQLRFYHPGDLTVGADTGMTAAALNATLAERGQWVPLDVPQPEATTLGTILAAHRSGPLRHRYGTVRDFTIGLELATAAGELVHSGGRVVKNVAGYDWMKLAIGARGAFGIITGVNFKVFPRPQAFLTAVFSGLVWDQVEGLRSALLRSPLRPLALDLAADAVNGRRILLRAAGSPAVLARYRRECEALAGAGNCPLDFVADSAAEASLWTALTDFPQPGDQHFSCPPAAAVARLRALPPEVSISGRLGLGVYWIRDAHLPPAVPTPEAAALTLRLKRALDPDNRFHAESCA